MRSAKCAAEQIVLNARGAAGQPLGTVLRLGAIYGSRIKGNYERLTHALARNRFVPIGSGLNRRTLVYDKDVARAAALAVSHPAAAGQVFNVTDGGFHTLNEIETFEQRYILEELIFLINFLIIFVFKLSLHRVSGIIYVYEESILTL